MRGPGGGAADLTDVQGTLAVDVGVAVPAGTVADTVVLLLGATEVGRQLRVGPGRQTFTVATAAWDPSTGVPTFRNGITALGTRLSYRGATVRGGPLALALRNPDVLVAQAVTPVAGAERDGERDDVRDGVDAGARDGAGGARGVQRAGV